MEWMSASTPPTASQTRPEASNSSSAQRADRSMAWGSLAAGAATGMGGEKFIGADSRKSN
jgi:hypothetical protein